MLNYVKEFLPDRILNLVLNLSEELKKQICEIRLRKNSPVSLTTYTKNINLDKMGALTRKINNTVICSENDINFTINRLCEGSVYRYMPTINSGYIVTSTGMRAGICGECIYEKGKISAVTNFSSVNLRIPHEFDDSGDVVAQYLYKNPNNSVLVVSPPGFGKTTIIRSVAKTIGSGKLGMPRRVCVIDERGEILPYKYFGLIDRFLGYSKKDGMEICVRLFSPELIVCDEIGESDDVLSLLSLNNTGVPILATTHGTGFDSCMKRPNIKKLIDSSVFQAIAVIEKDGDGNKIILTETSRE